MLFWPRSSFTLLIFLSSLSIDYVKLKNESMTANADFCCSSWQAASQEGQSRSETCAFSVVGETWAHLSTFGTRTAYSTHTLTRALSSTERKLLQNDKLNYILRDWFFFHFLYFWPTLKKSKIISKIFQDTQMMGTNDRSLPCSTTLSLLCT